jgi:hypothetical protein
MIEDISQVSDDIDPETGNFRPIAEEKTPEQIEAEKVGEEMLKSLFGILDELKKPIERGEYSLIVGDDYSGRIPALFLYETIKRISEATGLEAPQITFVSSGKRSEKRSYDKDQAGVIADHLTKAGYAPQKGKRALLVTESLSGGGSVKVITTALKADGFKADTVVLNGTLMELNEIQKLRLKGSLTSRWVEGERGSAHLIQNNHQMAGTVKGESGPVTERFEGGMEEDAFGEEVYVPRNQASVNAMREVIDKWADFLAKDFVRKQNQ